MKKIFDYIFFLRPMLILPILTIVVLGMRSAQLHEGASPIISSGLPVNLVDILLCLLATILISGAVYIFNQIHDIESDRINGKLHFLPDKIISISSAYVMTILLSAISLVLAFISSVSMGLIFIIILLVGFMYSHPRTNHKAQAGKALWANIFGCGALPFLIGWVFVNESLSLEGVIKSIPYMMAVAAVYFNTILLDNIGDALTNKKTYAVIWTTKRCQTSAIIRISLAVVCGLMAGDFVVFIASLAVLPLFVIARVKQDIAFSTKASMLSILILSVFAVIYLPLYALIFIVAVASTRLFYKKRFNVSYPSCN